MEIKLLCQCGTKFAFDAEPVDGRMPFTLNCPTCNLDCTEYANACIAQALAAGTPPPAPAQPAPAAAPTPAVGLRLRSHAAAPAAAPAAASSPPAPSAGGGLKLHTRHAEPAPATESPAPAASEEEVSAEARRARAREEARRKQEEQNVMWAKVAMVGRLIGLFLVLLLGGYFWYYFSGSKPKEYYTVRLPGESHGARAQLLGPDELIVADGKSVALHDLKNQKAVWSVNTGSGEPSDGGGGGPTGLGGFRSSRNSGSAHLHVTAADIWVLQGGSLLQLDRRTGSEKKRIPVAGYVAGFAPSGNSLMVVAEGMGATNTTLRVDLATGETASRSVAARVREEIAVDSSNNVQKPPTAGNLMADEFLEKGRLRLAKQRSETVSAGDHFVRMDVKLVKEQVVQVKVMSDAPSETKLGSKTRASSNPLAIAQETFNDIKRSSGDAYQAVDESTYEVTLTRLRDDGGGEPWTGSIVGNPGFIPGNTVDVVTGNKEIFVVDKSNKLLAEAKLQYPIGPLGGLVFRRRENAPMVETADSLYFYDQGTLTAFDLPSGAKRWDYNTVGITCVTPDDRGALYVCTTTASPDSIQFSEDIQLQNRPQALLLKLDAKTGKPLWRAEKAGRDVYVSGKYVYATRPAGSTLSLMAGEDAPERTWVLRINPRNGKSIWEYIHKGEAEAFSVFGSRFMILGGDEVKVMKHLTF